MSNLQAAIQVADQLIKRLFDQRQFTSGEINYLTREIGERSKLEDNFDKILKINEKTCVISDTSNTNLCNLNDETARGILEKVSSIEERTKNILNLERKFAEKRERMMAVGEREADVAKADCDTGASTSAKQG